VDEDSTDSGSGSDAEWFDAPHSPTLH